MPDRNKYRINLRLGKHDEELLRKLEDATGQSRTALLVSALRHLYWSVMVKDQPIWISLPPDMATSEPGSIPEGQHARKVAK